MKYECECERFCEYWQKKPTAAEYKLAAAYIQAEEMFESIQLDLVKCLRIEKKSDKFVPVFSSGAGVVAGPHWDAERHLEAVASDIKEFCEATAIEGVASYAGSLMVLADNLSRARRQIDDSDHMARVELSRAVRNGAGSLAQAEELPVVQSALDRRDRLKAELAPKAADLQARLSKARSILEKYSSS